MERISLGSGPGKCEGVKESEPNAVKGGEVCIGLPGGASGKEPACQCRRCQRRKFDRWVRKSPWRRAWYPTSVFLPGKSHGQRNLAGYSPCGCIELDLIEQLSTPYNSEGEE